MCDQCRASGQGVNPYGGALVPFEFTQGDGAELEQTRADLEAFGILVPEFRKAWDIRLQRAADRACAGIARQKAAGLDGDAADSGGFHEVPMPGLPVFDPAKVFGVFGLQLLDEVKRRLNVMDGPAPDTAGEA